MKNVVFGLSNEYRRFKNYINGEVVAYFDNYLAGENADEGKIVEKLNSIVNYKFDRIIIAGWNRRKEMIDEIGSINRDYLKKTVLLRDLINPHNFISEYSSTLLDGFKKKYYMAGIGSYMTGGVEDMHMLVQGIRDVGGEAYMAYYTYEKELASATPDDYKKYVNGYTMDLEDVEDDEKNVIIVPEINTRLLDRFKKAEKWIWWLSVDNHLKYFENDSIRSVFEADYHLYQSEYARKFLYELGVPHRKVRKLGDYISFEEEKLQRSKKLDQVVYNPAKGEMYTKLIINAAPDIKFVAIQNMTHEQVKEVLNQSKVYIDFGNHPGMDKIPREAALGGCIVITGKKGAAENDIDIPIPNDYKFCESDLNLIVAKIKNFIDHYDEYIEDFIGYRLAICHQRESFLEDIKQLI